jgi:uncharacterized protein
MDDILIFNVGPLCKAPTGTSENFSFEDKDSSGKVEIMRIKEGFNVKVEDFKTKVEEKCEKCLKSYKQDIEAPFAERFFYIDLPENPQDPNDTFLIDKKNFKINISEMLRQEIILHFPAKSVCCNHCKGLCPVCGADLNKKSCECETEKDPQEKPLSKLKEYYAQASSTKKEDS